MANVNLELPSDLLSKLNDLEINSEKMMMEMTEAGAEEVVNEIKSNLSKSFKSDKSLLQGLMISKAYRTPSDDGINNKVIFAGYNDENVAIPLIAMAREYGTSSGETKKPFFRKSFKSSSITSAMEKAQEKYMIKD